MTIYVSNISQQMAEQDIRQIFSQHGRVTDVVIVMDPFSGKPSGFGYVDMPNKEEANVAIKKLNGLNLNGQLMYADHF